MMTKNKFILNDKFLSFDGVLSRRDFIANYCIIQLIISLIFVTPFFYTLIFYPELMKYFNINSAVMNNSQPLLLTIGIMISSLVENILLISSIVRRFRDLLPEREDNQIYIISYALVLCNFITSAPLIKFLPIFKFLTIFILAFLMLKKGIISSLKPRSAISGFNFGAFWGTWIWGLINKTYKPLWMILLTFTPAGLLFMIICGLKGNKWAFKKNTPIETFKHKQYKQSVALLFLAPIISMTLLIGLFSQILHFNKATLSKNLNNWTNRQVISMASSYFINYDLSNEEKTFFITPQVWMQLSEANKIQIFNTAVIFTEIKTGITDKSINKTIELAKNVKILSSFNNEILAQYILPANENSNSKKTQEDKEFSISEKLPYAGYVFNNNPTIP